MTTNAYFPQGYEPEQNLVDDLITESIQIYGQDIYYLPKEDVVVDEIFLEPNQSAFNHAYPVEMYVETFDGFASNQDLFQKFGLEIRDQFEFRVMKARFEAEVTPNGIGTNPQRPNEGDILYFPLLKSPFVVKYVEQHDKFMQLNGVYTYLLKTENMEYSGETFNTGITEIDEIEWKRSPAITVNCIYTSTSSPVESLIEVASKFTRGSLFSQVVTNSSSPELKLLAKLYDVLSVVADDVLPNTFNITLKMGNLHFDYSPENDVNTDLKYDAKMFFPSDSVLLISENDNTFTLEIESVIGYTNSETGEDVLPNDELSQNQQIEDAADDVIDFTEGNPFGNF